MYIQHGIIKFINAISVERNLSAKTVKAYKGDLNDFSSHYIGKTLEAFSANDIREYIESKEKSRIYKDTTMRRKIASLKVFFNFFEREGVITNSPVRSFKKQFIISKRLPKVMSMREIKRLLRAAYKEVESNPEWLSSDCTVNGKYFRT